MTEASWAAFIVKQRKALSLTQEQLAEALYVTGMTVSRWERAEMTPGAREQARVRAFFAGRPKAAPKARKPKA